MRALDAATGASNGGVPRLVTKPNQSRVAAALLLWLFCVACATEIPDGAKHSGVSSNAGAAGVGGNGATVAQAGSAGLWTQFDFVQPAAGPRHSCARLIDGRVKCWGQNGGWLGDEDYLDRGDEPGEMGQALPAVNLGLGVVADAVFTRDLSVCALLHPGQVKCWGNNSMGELGQGDSLPRGGDPATLGDQLLPIDLGERGRVLEIAMGGNHVCARLETGLVLCWGGNDYGELGQGDTLARGDGPGEMGPALLPVQLGADRYALQISAGLHHTCALLDDHTIKCWGQNNLGQLGAGDILQRGDEPNEMGDALPKVELGQGKLARGVYSGQDFNCAILEDRRVKCWGNNDGGQLGNGTNEPRGDVAERMGDALPYTDLGAGFSAKSLALGSYHACALSMNGDVKCWGLNGDGQLGSGFAQSYGVPAETMGDALPAIDFGRSRRAWAIAAGSQHNCAALDDGNLVCWGNNISGQLGLGDCVSRGSSPSQIGENFVNTLLD